MASQTVNCPHCGAKNKKYGGANEKRKHESNSVCSECGSPLPCPVCQAHEYDENMERDHAPPGWFVGETTGKQLACHFCNVGEAYRQTGRRI